MRFAYRAAQLKAIDIMPSQETWALVVEDDAHNLIVISALLKEIGLRYKRNTTGANVVSQVNEMYPRPAIVLLDLDLPDGDPYQICADIRQNPYTDNIFVIALRDESVPAQDAALLKHGFTAVLSKPLSRREFAETLAELLGGGGGWARGCSQHTA